MKNIYLLPTTKSSNLYTIKDKLFFEKYPNKSVYAGNQYIYITNSEEIKEGDWFMSDFNSFPLHNIKELSEREGTLGWTQKDLKNNLKIILTTDQDLIKDGVQAIDDEFLEWFVKNPSCESVEIEFDYNSYKLGKSKSKCYKIIIPSREPKQKVICTNEICQGECIECNFMSVVDIDKSKDIPYTGKVWEPTEKEEEKINEAGEEYSKGVPDAYDIDMFAKYAFINGAKSNEAKNYWYKIFKSEQNGK